jgi:cytochrome c
MKKVLLLAALGLLGCGSALASNDLAKAKNCMTCHTVESKVLGPSFKDVAKKYAGDKTAEEKLTVKIIKGGTGVWGSLVMPANNQVTPAEAQTLVKWIMSLK